MSDSCEKKSEGAQLISQKIAEITGKFDTSIRSINDLQNLAPQFASNGGINDIVKIAKSFFNTPVDQIPVENLKLDNPNKKLGKFKIEDLSDAKGIDVTKAFPLKAADLQKLDSLKFSISTPVMEVVKTLKFGVITLKMKFSITKKGFTYFPVIDLGIDSKEKALASLKGVKSTQPVSPSKISLIEAKKLAAQSYGNSKEVADAIASSLSKEDFFQQLADLGIVLFQEVDIEAEMKKMLSNEEALKNSTPFEDDDCCGYPNLSPAPFNPEELIAIEKECCSPEATQEELIANSNTQKEEAFALLANLLSGGDTGGGGLDSALSSDQEKDALDSTKNFLADVDAANNVIRGCANEKQNALNNYYWYLEASFLNEISLIYTETRAIMLDSLNGSFASLEAARIQKIERSVYLKGLENQLYIDTLQKLSNSSTNTNWYAFLYGTSTSSGSTGSSGASGSSGTSTFPNILKIDDQFIRQDQLNAIEQDLSFSTAVTILRNDYQQNEQDIISLSSQIEDQKRNFSLPSFTETEIQNLQTLEFTSSTSVLAQKTKSFRENFSILTNPITNQIGYGPTGTSDINLQVHPYILNEAKALFALTSPEQGDVSNYVTSVSERKKIAATSLWNKYYSPNRIDEMFTYLEQGYTSPKPAYDSNGNPIDSKVKVKIPNAITGGESEQEIASSLLNLGVNEPVALDFWQNLEQKTYEKIIFILNQIRQSDEYKNFITQIKAAAQNEAKYSYAVNLIYQETSYTVRAFDSYTNSFSFNQANINNSLQVNVNTQNIADRYRDMYTMSYDSVKGFQTSLDNKLKDLNTFIETKKKCIADQEKLIEEKSEELGKKSNTAPNAAAGDPASPASIVNTSGSGGAAPIKNECAAKLGSDPTGSKPAGDCPGPIKNCYWKEYTKLMQIVSLMPIPDTMFLNKRLFRYYPVAIQIPVPSPAPVVLPTLALGIPDPIISIPLPLVWKHIITISTPIGMFVIWISLCGPIPGPYVLYFDEKNEPCFLITPKGPISVPAKSLMVQAAEEKELIDYLPIKNFFKVPLGVSPFNKLIGTNLFKATDPDDPTTVIDNIQGKIKAAIDSVDEYEPDFKILSGTEEEIKEKKKKLERIKNAFKKFPPDLEAIQDAFSSVETIIDKQVDSLKISPIKFPKNPKKLLVAPLGPAEFMESINKLMDAALNPAELGLGIKFISLRSELKKMLDKKLSDPDVKAKFKEINQKIQDLEAKLAVNVGENIDVEKVQEAIKERTKIIKEAIKAPLQKVADEITPEILGFIALLTPPLPLPVPCYGKVTIEPLPPYILAIIAAIKALPSLVDSIPDDALSKVVGNFLNLAASLPRIEDVIFFAIKAFLTFTPDLKFPDPKSVTMIKQVIMSAIQDIFKLKIRLPHPGAIQITITESMIKGIIKTAIKAAFAAVVKLIIDELVKATQNKDIAKVLAVLAIVKAIFGTDLGSLSGADIKSFITSSLEVVNSQLEQLKALLVSIPDIDFKSIKETLFPTLPPKIKLEGPFLEVGTKEMLAIAEPALKLLQNVPIPFPLVLLGCTLPPTRLILSKIHPFSAKEPLPSWEKLTLKNLPFVIWLDQLIATAQRQGGLVSDYVIPYYLPDPPA